MTIAALATSATALKLVTQTTTLAQGANNPTCHGTYAYECIEEKVKTTLTDMTNDVQSHKDDCLESANDYRETLVDEIKDLKNSL